MRFARILFAGSYGYFFEEDCLIEIDESQSDEEAQITLLHEMVHLWQSSHGYPVTHGVRFKRMAALALERTGLVI